VSSLYNKEVTKVQNILLPKPFDSQKKCIYKNFAILLKMCNFAF